ncbi:hypothetical protein LY474_16365 [Myxococcus stipitatus]|uniref:hypothetical protein n=1 Tax=Myxococcus stipitatus TaxID=83455 RepID=UPI001F23C30F|nr:hypothetical protein [Myxococcus stipitatus]MCE9669385.1 hypothetical protein [Myxococcus stipitatus]
MDEGSLFSQLTMWGAALIGFIGVTGMRVLVGVAIEGRWPRSLGEGFRYIFLMGDIRSRRMQLYAILWFFGCAATSILFVQVMIRLWKAGYGRWS